MDHYPVAILEDRYTGAYSRGRWLAIANSDAATNSGEPRIAWCLEHGPNNSDVVAEEFWKNPPTWIAVGETPNEALAALYRSRLGSVR